MGFAIDVEHYLDSCEAIDNISVSETQDHVCLLEIRGDITDQVSTVQEINKVLAAVWQGLAYRNFQATSCQWYREATIFRFVTVVSGNSFYVTGKIVIGGGKYPLLVERYDQDFGMLGCLSTMG